MLVSCLLIAKVMAVIVMDEGVPLLAQTQEA